MGISSAVEHGTRPAAVSPATGLGTTTYGALLRCGGQGRADARLSGDRRLYRRVDLRRHVGPAFTEDAGARTTAAHLIDVRRQFRLLREIFGIERRIGGNQT